MKKDNTKNDVKPMSLMSLLLSFLSLFVISGILFFNPDANTLEILIDLDLVICSLFLLQWTVDFIRSANKKEYLSNRWVELLASIPLYEPLRFGRIFQIIRVVRLIRSGKHIFREIHSNRREATLASILFLLVMLLTLGSGLMMFAEIDAPGANIQSGSDALWWAFVTVSTVGYGDHFPVTDTGKLLAAVIIICGVGIFGTISGLITSILSNPGKSTLMKQEKQNSELLEQLLAQQKELLTKVKRLEKQISTNKKASNE